MEIRHRLYPYPVLGLDYDSYQTGSFNSEIALIQEGYNVRITFKATLECISLQRLIDEGKAKFVYHLECAQTGFRKVVKTEKVEDAYVITNREVRGRLQICPFVVAVDDITGYSSSDFDEDYAGVSFDIEAGCVLAVGDMVTATINKDIEDLANTPSIFSILRNSDETVKEMRVDYSGERKIRIILPINDFFAYKSLSASAEAQPMLSALTVLPALSFVLNQLQQKTVLERADNDNALWYKTLKKSLANQFACDIESDDFTQRDPLELAQKLINDPLADAFHFLSVKAGGDEE